MYGASYKPDIDDFRESPSIVIADHLIRLGHQVYFIEPNGKVLGYPNINLSKAFNECDIVVVLVGHSDLQHNLTEFENNSPKVLDFTGTL